jgi:arsenite methyltransferase
VSGRDCWADWLLRRRFPGDAEVERRWRDKLLQTRDRVLDGARVGPGKALLDVGCGDGLIAFGALERGADPVIFSDISRDLLDESRRLAEELGVLDRCRFVVAAADDLAGIDDESVDAVTTRSVLIYVDDKERAFREFHRVLTPGGRASLFEPINRHNRLHDAFDVSDVQDLADRVKGVFEALQPRETDPMLNFDERDLIDTAEAAGFARVYLTLEVETEPPEPMPWATFANISGNPKIPTLGEAMEQALSPAERERLESHWRPLVESGVGSRRMATAYLRAVKEG